MEKGTFTVAKRRALLGVGAGWLALAAAAVFLVYYWRVFYSFDRFSPLGLTLLVLLVLTLLYAAVLATRRFVPTLAGRAAVLLAAAGLCFCFTSPPLQVPDESEHYLRAYAISMGRFNFDASRGYPRDVDLLLESFPGAYTNGQDGMAVKQYYRLSDPTDPDSDKLPQGPVRSIADAFAAYRQGVATLAAAGQIDAPARGEPLVAMLLPYLHQALAMALTRLFGGGALACLYAARLANLAAYTALAYAALRGLRRWQGAFLAVLFLPLSLYMAASLNYDALLLGLYALAASLLLQEELRAPQLWAFFACVAVMNTIKPWVNLLWLFGLLFIDKRRWKSLSIPWRVMAFCLVGTLGATALFTWYGKAFRLHYGTIGRMLGAVVDPLQQFLFVLRNPLRTLAVLCGTLFENGFFLPGLGDFGALDTHIPVVAWLSLGLLLCGAFADVRCRPLGARSNGGLGCFVVVYSLAVMMGMYITYTPVGMVRVIGLQARYFLPVVLLGLVLLAQLLGVLQRRAAGDSPLLTEKAEVTPDAAPKTPAPKQGGEKAAAWPAMLPAGFVVAVLGALLVFQTYFIGPVGWALAEV